MPSSSSSSSTLWLALGTATLAAAGAYFGFQHYQETVTIRDGSSGGNKEDGSSSSNSKSNSTSNNKSLIANAPKDLDALIQQRFESCVQYMKVQLPKMPQTAQLELYGLYKQASLGPATEFLSRPPPSYDLVAAAKYKAWNALVELSRPEAMQQYIDKALHFEFTRSMIGDGDDEDYELEGDAIMDMQGMGNRPSTLAGSGGVDGDGTTMTAAEIEEQAQADAAHPLHAAARRNQRSQLEILLVQEGHSPDELDTSGQTAMHLAADAGHPECIQLLVTHGANVQAADHDGISVLQAAVIGGDVETCRLLLTFGADPDQPDIDGDTPRGCAEDDPALHELLFRASQGQSEIDADFQQEVQTIGEDANGNSKRPTKEDLNVLDEIPVDLDDGDGDM